MWPSRPTLRPPAGDGLLAGLLVWGLGLVGLGVACTGDGDTAAPATPPWELLEPVQRSPARTLIRTVLPDAEAPERLLALPTGPTTVAWDPAAGRGWILDGHYHHDPLPYCVDTGAWPQWAEDAAARQEDCAAGEARIQRGVLRGSGMLVAAAADATDAALWAVGRDGVLWRAEGDPLAGSPIDHLRPVEVGLVEGVGTTPGLLAVSGGGGLFAQDGLLHGLSPTGAHTFSQALPAKAQDLVFSTGVGWVLTAETVGPWGSEARGVAGEGGRLAPDGQGGVWVALPAEERLLHLDAEGGELLAVDLPGLRGAVARAPRSGRLWVASDGGLVEVDPGDGAVLAEHALDPVVDLAVHDSGEVAVLHEDASVAVVVDEASLSADAPLDLTVIAYLENPKPTDVDADCRDLRLRLRSARNNRLLLDDLPAEIALGIIPEVGSQARACGHIAELSHLWEGPRIHPGLFFHGGPDDGVDLADAEAYHAFLAEQVGALFGLGMPVRWLGSPDRHLRYGADWVTGVAGLGLSTEVLGLSMGALPEVGAEDPRSKEPVPWDLSAPRSRWRPASVDDPLADDAGGPLRATPGLTTSLFTLGGCANTFVIECKQLGQGGGTEIDTDDLAVLDLALWRGLALRPPGEGAALSLHLPAIGLYDYTRGCAEEEGRWVEDPGAAADSGLGEVACEGGLLQDWVFDVHARYVDGGLVRWWAPGSDD